MNAKHFYDNGNVYMTEYYTDNKLKQIDIYDKIGKIKFSTFFDNNNIRDVFNGVGMIYYNANGTIKKKLYYVNGEISTIETYQNNKIVNCEYKELKNKFFLMPLYINRA